MSFSFLAPIFLWTLLGLPIVIALHFIRARKKRYEVSSLFLWQQAKEMANTRRRFSASWLLALQLLFVTLAALALAQPSFRFAGRPERVVIIDASASMAAQDSDGVRLDKAVSEAQRLIRAAGSAAVVRAGLDATILQAPTSTRADLNSALNSISATDQEANLERAIALARSAAPGAELHILSDSQAPSGPDITFHPVGGDGLNLGVSTFDIGLGQAFVAVVSNHPRPQEVGVELLQDGAVLASTTLLVPASGQANTLFPLGQASGFFEVRLSAPDWDALELDNTAYAGKRTLQAVLNQPQPALERALTSIPDLEYQVLPNAADNASFDVRIQLGSLAEGAAETVSGNILLISGFANEVAFQTVRSWDRSDALLRFVDLSEVVVGVNTAQPNPYPAWQTLAQTGDLNPVLQRLDTDTARLVALNVHPTQTDMVNRTAFPLLLTNVINSFRDEARLTLGEPLAEGSTLLGEDTQDVSEVRRPGLYDVGGDLYSASLLSAPESRLTNFREETANSQTSSLSSRVQSVALWLVGIATLALLFEWLLWSRSNGKWRFGLGRE